MKKKKIIVPILIVLIVLVILAGTFAFLWFKTSLFNFLKPSKDLFTDQLKTAFNIKNAKYSDYSEILKKYKGLSEKPVKSKLNISAKLNMSELDDENQDIINKSKITLESNTDIKNKKSQSKIELYSDNSEVLTIDMIKNDDKISLGCKDLYDKYLTYSKDNFVERLKEDGNMTEEEIELFSKIAFGDTLNIYDLLYISDEDLKHFDNNYSIDKILDLISKDCFSKGKKVEIEVDDKEVKADTTYLTLTGSDAYKFVEDFSDKLKNDSVVTKLAAEKANMILEYTGKDKISEADVTKHIDKTFDRFLDELEDLKDEKDAGIQIAIYSKNNKPVRIDFNKFEDADDSDKETLLSIEFTKNKDIYTFYNNGKSYMSIVNDYEKKEKNEYKGKLTLKVNGISIGTLNYEIVLKDKETKFNLELKVPLADVSMKIEMSSKGDYNKEPVDVNGIISFKYGKESAEIKYDGTVEFGDASITELNSSNSVDILKLSDEDAEKEYDKIRKKASEVLPTRLKLIGINVDAKDIYEEKVEIPETTSTNIKEDLDEVQNLLDQINTL